MRDVIQYNVWNLPRDIKLLNMLEMTLESILEKVMFHNWEHYNRKTLDLLLDDITGLRLHCCVSLERQSLKLTHLDEGHIGVFHFDGASFKHAQVWSSAEDLTLLQCFMNSSSISLREGRASSWRYEGCRQKTQPQLRNKTYTSLLYKWLARHAVFMDLIYSEELTHVPPESICCIHPSLRWGVRHPFVFFTIYIQNIIIGVEINMYPSISSTQCILVQASDRLNTICVS